MLVYKSTGETGFYEYARREDGAWFSRYVPYTREGTTGRPGPWKRTMEPNKSDLPLRELTPVETTEADPWYVPLPPGE